MHHRANPWGDYAPLYLSIKTCMLDFRIHATIADASFFDLVVWRKVV